MKLDKDNPSIPREYLKLGNEDREKKELVSCKVVAELPLGLLKAGLDIIDSPGRNENQELDEVTAKVSMRVFLLGYTP